MEEIFTNWIFYSIIAIMLLGAYVLGFFFGKQSGNTVVVKTEKVAVPLVKTTDPTMTTDQKQEPTESKRIEIDELTKPGPVRAMKTRDRSGYLSEDAKLSIAEQKLDFNVLGRGDRFHKDDLQKLTGIGPFVEEKLNSVGIYNYSQLARMDQKQMEVITSIIDFFPGRIKKDDWKGQAIEFTKKKNETTS